jgi:O-antigen/teichoic acid export membrane protein
MQIISQTNIIKALQSLSAYGISHFITIIQPIIITPLITRRLSLEEYGTYSLYFVFLTFLIPIISLNFSSFVLKEFYNELKNELKKYLDIFISISFISLITILGVTFIFKDLLKETLELPSINIVYYAVFSSFFLTIITLSKSVLRSQNQTKMFVLVNLFLVISITLMVSVLYYFDILSLNSVLAGFAITYGFGSLIIMRYVLKINLLPSFILNTKIIKRVLKFSLPLVLYSLTAMIFVMSDRLIINHFISKNSLAVYSATFQLAFGVAAFGTVLQLAWNPFVFKQMTSNIVINRKIKVYGIIAIVCLVIYSIIYLVLFPIVFQWYYPIEYLGGLEFFHWFIFGGMIQSIYWLVNPILMVLEKNMYFFYITLFSAVISICCNIYFVDFGIKYFALVYFISWLFQLIALISVTAYWYRKKIKLNLINVS